MPQNYYQLGGFRSPIKWFLYNDKGLAECIAGTGSPLKSSTDDPVELALGIKPSGTSHLLLTVDQTHHVADNLFLERPQALPLSSMDFESVSPIYFHGPHQLAKKLGTLKPKAQGSRDRPPTDNSQVNKHYVSREDGAARGSFEHGRLLYCILQDSLDLHAYALNDKSWVESLQICSFVFNTVLVDQRHSSERVTNPRVLDVGIAEADIPGIFPRSPIHIRGSWNAYLSRGKQGNFRYGTTEELDRDSANLRVKQYFADKIGSNTHPTILLVHDRQTTLNFLKNCGVDTNNWELGIKGLLGFETFKKVKSEPGLSRPNDPRRQQPTTSSSRHDDYKQRQHRPRSRSRSPRRSSESPYKPYRSPRRGPPSPRHRPGPRTHPPIYVIDIQELYMKLMQTQFGSESVNAISKQFGQPDVAEWCAGNEAMHIIDIWRSMISGASIDDQRANRTAPPPQLQYDTYAQTTQRIPDLADSDEERDPNDFAAIPATALLVSGAGTYGDDDSDYGQSDSD
ncbi:hypothetical protein BDZ94DRAFT_1248699 [Collybia nuda]|uniref:Uncharacterized protein n=1 Tax=Collybia nuda TaxID=64659 RepID=A0A9P6CP58_9AGAR|nr:hypothetical protein BDZ94DRAFT_1248699 [Collybia nuda]